MGEQLSISEVIKIIGERSSRAVPGVYFLVDPREVLYVGSSVNVYRRAVEHSRNRIPYHRFFVIETPHYVALERVLIAALRPPYNRMIARPSKEYLREIDCVPGVDGDRLRELVALRSDEGFAKEHTIAARRAIRAADSSSSIIA